jgi:hypothetical protein
VRHAAGSERQVLSRMWDEVLGRWRRLSFSRRLDIGAKGGTAMAETPGRQACGQSFASIAGGSAEAVGFAARDSFVRWVYAPPAMERAQRQRHLGRFGGLIFEQVSQESA